MTWTYAGAPGTSSAATRRDAVRLAVGDTDTTQQQLTDEEIAYFLLGTSDDVLGAAIAGCRALSFKYARQVNLSENGLSDGGGDRYLHYKELLNVLLSQESSGGLIVSAGGISVSDKEAAAEDTDLVQPIFSVGMNDNPGSGSNTPPSAPTT